MSIVLCKNCGNNISSKSCNECIEQLAINGIVWTQFGVKLTGADAYKYNGPLLRINSHKPKRIIQILGQSRSGKDWTALQLQEQFTALGKSVDILSYAAPMKRITATLFDISLDELDDFKNRPTEVGFEVYDDGCTDTHVSTITFRTFLQRLGNEAMKSEFEDSVWADLMATSIRNSKADIVIIPDCRFLVELNKIGGTTIRVFNADLPAPSDHASETELLNVKTDITLDNTGQQATSKHIETIVQRILHDS